MTLVLPKQEVSNQGTQEKKLGNNPLLLQKQRTRKKLSGKKKNFIANKNRRPLKNWAE